MKKAVLCVFLMTLVSLMATAAFSQEEVTVDPAVPDAEGEGYSTHVVGGTINMGMATMIVENCNNCGIRFAGGGGAYYNLYLAKIFAIHAGVGFMGRGLPGCIKVIGII